MQNFQKILGHEDILTYMQNAIKQDKVSHAYIFEGEKGAGKKFLAKLFAQTLQCEKKGSEPCQECHSCKQTESGNQPDIIWVTHEKATSVGVEDIRRQVNSDMAIRPYSSPYKIYIIPEAEKMTVQAQNALLKTIEEPPVYGIVILLAETIGMLLPTIHSRCVTLKLRPVRDSQIKEYLMAELDVPDYEAEICTVFAQGNVGRAKMLAESEHFNEIRNAVVTLLSNIRGIEMEELISCVKQAGEYQAESKDYLDLMMIWYRDVLYYKATKEVNRLVFRKQIDAIREAAIKSSYEGIEIILESLEKAKVRLRANVNFELVMELLFLTMKEN